MSTQHPIAYNRALVGTASGAKDKNMAAHGADPSSTTEGIPLTRGLASSFAAAALGPHDTTVNRRVWLITSLAIPLSLAATVLAAGLVHLIHLVTQLSFFGTFSFADTDPTAQRLGAWIIGVPVAGALVVGIMARFGSPAIRGHGIPEAMEQILTNESRIPVRVLFLKPLSAAIAIGTGGPFGAEGPIIATGGALGSLLGQSFPISADERKTLLAAGAAAGMTAIFGTPLAAVLLAIELLLFEFRTRSLIPVFVACGTAAVARGFLSGFAPFFATSPLPAPGAWALIACVPLGVLMGVLSVAISRAVYWTEDAFAHLPLHWMWWPALASIAVGVIGYLWPATLGVGYDNITRALGALGGMPAVALTVLAIAKLLSWNIALGSGTSGGTLAPLMTVGACLGGALGDLVARVMPNLHLDPRLAALVGMAALFSGASRALFMSILFAVESTWQITALVPVMIGASAAYLVSSALMQTTLMTEKIVRRGVRVPDAYQADFFVHTAVSACFVTPPVTISPGLTCGEATTLIDGLALTSSWLPVVREDGQFVGLAAAATLRTTDPSVMVASLARATTVVHDTASLSSAISALHHADPRVVAAVDPETGRFRGLLTPDEILFAYQGAHRR